MDIKRIIPLACLLVALLIGGKKLIKGVKGLMEPNAMHTGEEVVGLPAGLSRDEFGHFLRAPKKGYRERKEMELFPNECRGYVSDLQEIDLTAFKDISFRLTYRELPRPPRDCAIVDDSVSPAEKQYLKACILVNPLKTDTLSDACVRSIFLLRASLTRMVHQYKSVAKLTDFLELTDLLYAEMIGPTARAGEGQVPERMDFKRVKMIVDTMLEEREHFAGALRTRFFLQTIEAMESGKTKTLMEQDELWKGVANTLRELRALPNVGPNFEDADAVVETRGFVPGLTQNVIARRLASNPQDAKAHFYRSFANWRNGDRTLAVDELRKAVELNPAQAEYAQVLRQITLTNASGDEAYYPALGYAITAKDFDR